MNNYPTKEQLLNWASNNRNYFYEISDYYYKFDKQFYEKEIYPLFHSLPSHTRLTYNESICPYCKTKMIPRTWSKISTGGWIMIVVGLIFTPILIGIVLIAFGVTMKDVHKVCSACNVQIS